MDFEIKRLNAFKTLISYFLISILGAFFISIFVQLLQIKNPKVSASLTNLLVYIAIAVVLYLINKKEIINDYKELGKTKKLPLKLLGSLGIFYVISMISSTIVSNTQMYAEFRISIFELGNTITSTSENQSSIEAMMSGIGILFMFLSAGIIGPICEELVFRKAIFNLFKEKELGIIVSSIAFGMIHIISSLGMSYNFTSMALMTFPYIAAGFALGYIYAKNDCNLWVTTIIHMFTNIISLLGIILTV